MVIKKQYLVRRSIYFKQNKTAEADIDWFKRNFGIRQLSASDNTNIDAQCPYAKTKSNDERRARANAKIQRLRVIKQTVSELKNKQA